jgi:hypothetical protein
LNPYNVLNHKSKMSLPSIQTLKLKFLHLHTAVASGLCVGGAGC